MKINLQIAFICLFLVPILTSCSEKDPLIGTWQEPVSGIIMVFGNDGSLEIRRNETSYAMKFEEKDPNIIAVSSSGIGTIPLQEMTYQVKEDQLILIVDKVETLFIRIK